MTPEQKQHYRNHICLLDIGLAGQQRLLDARVLIIGLGGLGSPAAMYLAAAGIGTMVLCDFDRVEATNLQRQILYNYKDIGEAKTIAAQRNITAIAPNCHVITKAWQMDEQELITEVRLADVILDCSDNFDTRFTVNRACVFCAKTLISGAAIRHEGQIITLLPGIGPCYNCLYPDNTQQADIENDCIQNSCAQNGIIAPLVGIVGSLQALQAIRVILGQSKVFAGKLMLFNAITMEWRTLLVPQDPACPVCHASKK